MEDAADALGQGEDATYLGLVDTVESGLVWLPTGAIDALFDRGEVQLEGASVTFASV